MPQNYNREYYLKNKDKFLVWQRQYRLKNKESVRVNRVRYDSIYVPLNRDKILARKKQYRLLHPEKRKEYNQRPEVLQKQRERVQRKRLLTNSAYDKAYYQKRKLEHPEKLREIWRRAHKNNPRSGSKYSLECQLAMNNVRKRDNNTCQWCGCGLKHKATQIHVHHIFPRAEYPDLELVEQYMICYCVEHHAQFHAARGDIYSKLIAPNYQEREVVDYE